MNDIPDDWQHADVLAALQHLPPHRRGLALDLGAHRGVVTRLLLQHFARVVAVEPSGLVDAIPPEATRLRAAVGSAWGLAAVTPGRYNTGQQHLTPPGPLSPPLVPVVTLNWLYWTQGYRPDFIKLDVEGMERHVLMGGAEMLRNCRPVVMFEENGLCTRYGTTPGETGEYLESLGARRVAVLRSNPPDEDWVYAW